MYYVVTYYRFLILPLKAFSADKCTVFISQSDFVDFESNTFGTQDPTVPKTAIYYSRNYCKPFLYTLVFLCGCKKIIKFQVLTMARKKRV